MEVKKIGEIPNKTITPSVSSESSSKNKNKVFIVLFTILAVIIIAAVYYFVVHKNISDNNLTSSDSLKLKEIELKERELNLKEKELNSQVNNNIKNSSVELIGFYSGTINGSRWVMNIDYFDGNQVKGSSTCYWPSKAVTAGFSGSFNKETGLMELYEEQGRGSGKFIGTVTDMGKNISGNWFRYSDNTRYVWNLEKSGKENSYNNNIPGKYPEISLRLLVYDDLRNLNSWEKRIMKNEIYARHGYIFKTGELYDYFSKQEWYNPRFDNVEDMLSNFEKENIKLINSSN